MKTNYVIIFFSIVCIDIIYVFYLKHVARNNVARASAWASLITLFNGIAIVNYSYDVFSIVSAMLGAFIGTSISMKYFNRK